MPTYGEKKSVVLPSKNPRQTFEWFINQLPTEVDQALREKLHTLRVNYNRAKHDPATVSELLQALEIIQASSTGIEHIVKTGIASVQPRRFFSGARSQSRSLVSQASALIRLVG